MAHDHGSEYQIRIILADGTEELSGWLNGEERIAQAIVARHRPQAKACGFWNETFSVPTAWLGDRKSWNIPLRTSRLHDTAHTTPVICCK
jgi:hypothetical protein